MARTRNTTQPPHHGRNNAQHPRPENNHHKDTHKETDTSHGHGRGFQSMDPEKQREIASKGGRAPHEVRGFQAMDPEEQREIARKGGHASHGGGRKAQQPTREEEEEEQE